MRDILYTIGRLIISLICIAPFVMMMLATISSLEMLACIMILLAVIYIAAFGLEILIDLFSRF